MSRFRSPTRARDKLPRKTTLVAVLLLLTGVAFTIASLVVLSRHGAREMIPYASLAGVCLLPGAYASTVIVRTLLGHRGYSYDLLPSYDD
ncbi:MAG: hypothetical protein MHM6MM_008269 [Cercozoa sp. M6MM]